MYYALLKKYLVKGGKTSENATSGFSIQYTNIMMCKHEKNVIMDHH